MSDMITIHVLGFGELYVQLLNATATFMKQDGFLSLLRMTALIGIIMASVGYLKQRDPMVYAKWVLGYVLVFHLIILPKTTVDIYDIASQKSHAVDNVPVVFAVTASLVTSVGVGLAESFDELFSLPDDLTYTKTGSLFGSKIIQASRDFRIMDPQLKTEMDGYLRNCVVGDIRLNQKYSVGDLGRSLNIWDLISKEASPLRMTIVNNKAVTCQMAASNEGAYSLHGKLNAEIKKAYTFFGINLFGRQKETNYEKLFETHLTSSFDYYQHMTDTSADIFLQSMMINAVGDGIKNYQAFTDSTAGVVNNQVTKSQVQHRWAWAIAGQKAAWFLPILYTVLTLLLFGIFPVIMVMSTLPNGAAIFKGYLQFFVSLQFWPVLFSILNLAAVWYGSQSAEYGGLTMVNIDKIDEFHSDLSGVAGYLMLMIPFIAKGFVSSLSDAFSGLATSMTSHLQGSAMSVANDAASASFSLGQTSFYNTSANSLSANKHDTNWTNMHGMHTEQLGTGVTKTHTGSGDTVFDVSPGMTKSALAINSTDGLNGSFNVAAEESRQASVNAHQSFQTSLSNLAHKALSLSQVQGHDMRLGAGVSTSETGQYQTALSTMSHIASDVAQRTGVSTDQAMQRMMSAGIGASAGISTSNSALGLLASKAIGLKAGADAHLKYDRTSTGGDKLHDNQDSGVTAREASDFNAAFSHVQHFVKNHHFDDSQSSGANLSNQLGADLRGAEVASKNYDASMARSSRISQATSYVKSQGDQITTNLEQEFPAFVKSRVGDAARDELFSHPGDARSVQSLQGLSHEFMQHEREEMIAKYGNAKQGAHVDGLYQEGVSSINKQAAVLGEHYETTGRGLARDASELNLGVNDGDKQASMTQVNKGVALSIDAVADGRDALQSAERELTKNVSHGVDIGRQNAARGVFSTKHNDDKQETK